MTAILHCVITEIENDNHRYLLKSWKSNMNNDYSYQRLMKYKTTLDDIVKVLILPQVKEIPKGEFIVSHSEIGYEDCHNKKLDTADMLDKLKNIPEYTKVVGIKCSCDLYISPHETCFGMTCQKCSQQLCPRCWCEQEYSLASYPRFWSNNNNDIECPFCGHLNYKWIYSQLAWDFQNTVKNIIENDTTYDICETFETDDSSLIVRHFRKLRKYLNGETTISENIETPKLSDITAEISETEKETTNKTIKKYERKCPNDRAKNFDLGYVALSENDNNRYIVYEDKNNVKKWKKYKDVNTSQD